MSISIDAQLLELQELQKRLLAEWKCCNIEVYDSLAAEYRRYVRSHTWLSLYKHYVYRNVLYISGRCPDKALDIIANVDRIRMNKSVRASLDVLTWEYNQAAKEPTCEVVKQVLGNTIIQLIDSSVDNIMEDSVQTCLNIKELLQSDQLLYYAWPT